LIEVFFELITRSFPSEDGARVENQIVFFSETL